MAINTAEDVIRVLHDNPGLIVRVLRESPEALAEARSVILTDEVLALPERFDQMLDAQNRMLDVQNQMLREIRHTNRRVDGLNETVGRLEALNETVGRLEEQGDRIDSRVGHLIGSELERKLAVIVPHRLRGRFEAEISQILVYQDRDPVVSPDFLIRIDEDREAGLISAEQHRRIRNTDMIVQARTRQDDDDIYFAIEAGVTLEKRDIDRAIASAELIESVLDTEAIPLVVAYTIPDDVRRYNTEERGGQVNILRARRGN